MTLGPTLRALLFTLLIPPALAGAQTQVIARSEKWEVLETELAANGELRCDLRSREIGAADEGDVPTLYFIGNHEPDYAFDVRVYTGDDNMQGAQYDAATIAYDDNPAVRAWAYPLSPQHFSIAPNTRELKLGGVLQVEVPRDLMSPARFRFSLIGFTAAYNRMVRCNSR